MRTPSLSGNTTFTLSEHDRARVVALAGSFNGWDSQHVLFGKEEAAGCAASISPPGSTSIDEEWINDPDNPLLEDSGNGGLASVIVKR